MYFRKYIHNYTVKELGSLHTKRLMVNFDTDEEEKEYQINMKTKEITDKFHHAETLLKKFSKDDGTLAQASEMKVKTNIQRSIAKRLQSLSMSFRRSQKEYMGRLKNQRADGSAVGILDLEEQKPSNDFRDDGFTQSQLAIVDDTAAVSLNKNLIIITCCYIYYHIFIFKIVYVDG